MVDAAFSGFKALPDYSDGQKEQVRYFDDCVDNDHARARYKRYLKEFHPDVGGDPKEFIEMKNQYEEFVK